MNHALASLRSTLPRADEAVARTLPSAAPPGAEGELPSATGDGGRYEPGPLLGEGGMGLVARARDRDLVRDVAVKQLRPELLDEEAMRAQFLWEARVTASLDHPNIVPVHDVGQTGDGQLYFTMKLVRGTTLDAAIARLRDGDEAFARECGRPRRLRLFLQLCHAVSFAHARGVLHRDLKPANVMLGEFGEVLVTDWGLALPLPGPAGDALRTLMPSEIGTQSAGTPQYMSPEQARGDALDARSDVYTLGVILFELLALRPAVEGTSVPQILARVLHGELPRLVDACPDAPHALSAVVAKATARDPADRYPDVRALAVDVETALDGRTPSAEHVSALRRLARFYVSRDPAMASLRVVDFDLWAGASFLVGAGLAARWAHFIGRGAWPLVALGVLLAIPPTVRWLRPRRRDDEASP